MYSHEPDRTSGEPSYILSPELSQALADLRARRDRTRKNALIVTAVCLVLFLLASLVFMACTTRKRVWRKLKKAVTSS